MVTNKSGIIAFWSYTHFDNKHDQQYIAWLRKRLMGEVRVQTGLDFEIYMDEESIRIGGRITDDLKKALESSYLLIPVVTPSYFRSDMCYFEYETFRKREASLHREDLILPIYYVEAEEVENTSIRNKKEWTRDLSTRKYRDWRTLRFERNSSMRLLKAVEELAKSIRDIIKEFQYFKSEEKVELSQIKIIDEGQTPYVEHIGEIVLRLTWTQKYIMQCMYEFLHRDEIAINDLFEFFIGKFGE